MYNILKIFEVAQPQLIERDLMHAKYYIGPLLRGQAITIACALRRTLLAEIDGLAFVGISIPDLDDTEYGSIPGLEEDFLELALNLKQIIVTCENRLNMGLARLKVSQSKKKSGLLTAQDLLLPPGYTVSNPHAYIARTTLANVDDFEIEFLIARGKGFVMADDLRPYLPDHFFPIEASFTPIKRVFFSFETSRDNKTETLIFEIRTFGTAEPDIFLQDAAFILECTFRRLRERKPTLTSTHEVAKRGYVLSHG
jgi:DNA-directed RNA polymerase subunit alpha